MSSPFKVHELLSSAELAELETFAREPGRTIDECHEWLQAKGFTLSRGAVGNWMAAFKGQLAKERFSRSGELASAITSAVSAGDFEKVANAAVMQLVQVVFEQSTQLESDGEIDPLDVMRMTRSLKNLVGSEAERRALLVEKFEKETKTLSAKKELTQADWDEARKRIFGV